MWRPGRAFASECLTDTKEKIEVIGPLRNELGLGRLSVHRIRNGIETGERRRIQIVPEIKADRTDGCLVVHPEANGVRDVVKVALGKTLPISWKTAKLMLSWKNGKSVGGRRNSNWFRNKALPPTGNPVLKSR